MTRRLVRYVENAVLRRTAADLADETGLSERQVADIAKDLAGRLRSLKFAPDVVAMDGIWCSHKRRFQVLTNGRTGHPLGVFEGLDAETACRELSKILDARAVRVFVTDMAPENIAVGRTLPNAIHVADKWHVIERCNKAVRQVVKDEADELKMIGRVAEARELRDLGRRIAGQRTPADPELAQFSFDLEKLPNPISRFPRIVAAHRARWQLIHFYQSADRATGMERLSEFRRRAGMEAIAGRMESAMRYIGDHENHVLSYFDVLETMKDGTIWAATTNHAERKNADLKAIWHQSRGFGQSDQFWLKAMFHPYQLDRHLVECGACGRIEGPYGPQEAINRASQPATLPQDIRCSTC
jgi:transposase